MKSGHERIVHERVVHIEQVTRLAWFRELLRGSARTAFTLHGPISILPLRAVRSAVLKVKI